MTVSKTVQFGVSGNKYGLRRRDKYEEVIGHFTGEKKFSKSLKAPDMYYKQLRESLPFTNLLDGMFDVDTVRQQQIRQAKRQEVEHLLVKSGTQAGVDANVGTDTPNTRQFEIADNDTYENLGNQQIWHWKRQ